jgi:hypothetical protein
VRVDGADEGDDGGSRDALSPDALPPDARSGDAPSRDALPPDALPPDAEFGDAPSRDARARDAPTQDAADGRGRTGDHDEAEATDASVRTERALGYRAEVEAVYRAYAIDQGCARVERVERETVTPAMRRIEAEDPSRNLEGLEHRLKGKDRLSEKVENAMAERNRTVDQALATVKDAIRYTYCYSDEHYADGVYADCERLESAGFERVELRNSWTQEEYKGINSRWRVPDSEQLFEVQFHTDASFEAKQETHWAYEKLRDPSTSKAEQETLSSYQCKITARIPVPPGATDIPDYRYP